MAVIFTEMYGQYEHMIILEIQGGGEQLKKSRLIFVSVYANHTNFYIEEEIRYCNT